MFLIYNKHNGNDAVLGKEGMIRFATHNNAVIMPESDRQAFDKMEIGEYLHWGNFTIARVSQGVRIEEVTIR